MMSIWAKAIETEIPSSIAAYARETQGKKEAEIARATCKA
eukprot:gene7308-3956_t